MWPLTNGLQCLGGDEAGLFRGVVGMMVDQLVPELNEGPPESDSPADGNPSDLPTTGSHPIEGLPDWLEDSRDELRDIEAHGFGEDGGYKSDGGYGDNEKYDGDHHYSSESNYGDDNHRDDDHEPPAEVFDAVEGFGFETPHLYSMWEPEQRLWLLERVATPLLTARRAPPAASVHEATVEAIYVELADLIAMEITSGTPIEKGSWRGSLLDAYVQRCPKDSLLGALQFEATTLDPCLPPAIKKQLRTIDDDNEVADESPENLDWLNWWTMVIERLVDATYGPRLYHDAEAYLDGDPRDLQRYLRGKGLNAKFMRRIPPLRTHEQTQKTIDRLQGILFQK